jgi:hypothetical protein
MTDLLISNVGLALCLAPALVHGAELINPLWARWVVNLVLPLFTPAFPSAAGSLSRTEQLTMLDAAVAAAPQGKQPAPADYVFLLLFEQRQGALAFLSLAVGAVYGLTLPLADRHALHLVFGVMSTLFMLVNANHAGVPLLGHHPRVTRNGRNVGRVFALVWGVGAACNWMVML